jgi:hypothetical protein
VGVRVECASCKQLVTAELAIDGTTIRATCPACAAQMMLPTVAAAKPPAVAPTGGEACPKCGAARRAQETSCPSCGLATARMGAYALERDAGVPEVVKAAWARVLEAWDELPRHDALFSLAAAHTAYAWIGGRYREQVRARPDDPIAEKQIDRLLRASEATLRATATTRKEPAAASYKGTLAILGVLVIVIMLGVVYAILKSKSGDDAPPPPPPRSHGSPAPSQVR